jgi:molybdopterin biosynthesis enzyme
MHGADGLAIVTAGKGTVAAGDEVAVERIDRPG